MTGALEHVADGDWNGVGRNFQKLMSLLPDTGGRSVGIRFGSDAVTWAGGSRTTAANPITHGLGRTPVAVLLTSSTSNMEMSASALGATTFSATGNTMDGTSPVNGTARTFYWLVVG